jgi:hypothetical protein
MSVTVYIRWFSVIGQCSMMYIKQNIGCITDINNLLTETVNANN